MTWHTYLRPARSLFRRPFEGMARRIFNLLGKDLTMKSFLPALRRLCSVCGDTRWGHPAPGSKRRAGASARPSHPAVEALEDRCLLSATSTAAIGPISFFREGHKPDDVARGFTRSTEYFTNLVSAAYQHFLGRAADA